jgi:hypothetical protein
MSRLTIMFYMMMESLNIDEVKNWKGSLRGKKSKDGKDPILKAIKELLTPSIFFVVFYIMKLFYKQSTIYL